MEIFKNIMQKIILKIESESVEWPDKNIECFVVNSSLSKKFIKEFAKKANSLDKIVLSEGNDAAALCNELDLDGVIADLSNTEEIKSEMDKIRKDIGGRILGVITRSRRHEAMIVSENEPDFVIFKLWKDGLEKLKELIDWYLEFFLLQLAVVPQDDDIDVSEVNSDIIIFDEKKYKIFVDKN